MINFGRFVEDLQRFAKKPFRRNLSAIEIQPTFAPFTRHFVDANNYSWTLVSTTAGITGFSAGDFTINTLRNNGTDGFSNPFTGKFSVDVSGNSLQLIYTAVPEPATWALIGLAALGLAATRRRRNG